MQKGCLINGMNDEPQGIEGTRVTRTSLALFSVPQRSSRRTWGSSHDSIGEEAQRNRRDGTDRVQECQSGATDNSQINH